MGTHCRRSLHRERGLKCETSISTNKNNRRSLHRERGLKYIFIICNYQWSVVAPYTGSVDWNDGLFPMKAIRYVAPYTGSVDWNLDLDITENRTLESLPTQGAWIEMKYTTQAVTYGESRSLHRERGLKCTYLILLTLIMAVAPYTGSVDWNYK